MKMMLRMDLFIEGKTDPMHVVIEDDVDAEGTMLAEHVDPIIEAGRDARYDDGELGPVEVAPGQWIMKPWKIVALEYSIHEGD